ncbi:MAG TPA: hypothetical protein DDY52_03250 [Candidatus Moranbacteria bacterium]|nr:hypothetical protein [Candidatus Moranbacteria bacterium]
MSKKYYRYGHLEGIKIKVGDIVKKNQMIAKNGTGNGQWYAHCHFDILSYTPKKFTEYCIGKSKDWVKDNYADPRGLEKIVMPTFHHYGLEWLEYWDYDSQSKKVAGAKSPCFHPGLDLNGKGSGNADLNDPIHSACDGVVVYVYSGTGKNEGWGDMVVVEEKKEEFIISEKVEEVKPTPEKIEIAEKPIENNPIGIEEEKPQEVEKIDIEEVIKSEVIPVNLKFILEKIIGLFNKFLR